MLAQPSLNFAEVEQIKNALRYLAGVCDGAVEQDNNGFNKIDTDFGKSLADQDNLSPNQIQAGAKLLQKYRGQLQSAGLEIPTLERTTELVGEQTTSKAVNSVKLNNQRVLVYFAGIPALEIRHTMKTVPQWRWESNLYQKPWSFPIRYAKRVIELFQATHAIDSEVYTAAEDMAEEAATQATPDVITLDALNGDILVKFPGYGKPPDDDLNKVKSLPVRRWRPELPGKPWSTPTRYYADLLQAFPEALVLPALEQLIADQKAKAKLATAETSAYRVEGLKGTPRPYQWAAMEFLERNNGRALIADDQGLGKCLEVYGYLQHHPELRPVVIACPSSVKEVWRREFYKWCTTDDIPEILESQTPYSPAGSILIINYEILNHWSDYIRLTIQPKIVVADEAHYCKNHKALRSKALMKIVLGRGAKGEEFSTPVPHFIPTTGTPITNRPIEIWTALHIIDPLSWKSRHGFGIEYGMAYYNGFGWQYDGVPDTRKLYDDIRPYVLRRSKADVLKELPPKMHIPLPLEIDSKHKKKYVRAVRDAQETIMRLEASHQPIGAEHLKLIEVLKQITAEAKLEQLTLWVKDTIENEKLILFCTHTKIINHFMTAFEGQAVEISGRVAVGPKRNASVDAFMNDPAIKLCVANIQAGGVGITLTSASKCIFAEFPWNPKDLDQASDRIHRIGQEGQAMIYYAAAADTIDEAIIEILIKKAHIIDEIMDGQAGDQLSVIKEVLKRFMAEAEQLEMGL